MSTRTKSLLAILLFLGLAGLGIAIHLSHPGGLPAFLGLSGQEKGEARYYCPMHPQYTSPRPGDCPICNMKLVPLKKTGEPKATEVAAARPSIVETTLEQRQLIGVQTGLVEKKRVLKPIRTVGRVEWSEKKLSAVSLKFGGWVEELHVKSTGEPVKRGQKLLTIYSPDLLEAQRNFLLALDARRGTGPAAQPAGQPPAALPPGSFMDENLKSARSRLLLWDITEDQLRDLEAKKEPRTRMEILSRVEGVVTKRNVVEGSFAEPGRTLFEIADPSPVWIHADLYEYELPEVKVGQEVQVRLASLPGETLKGRLTYLYPYLNEETRTVRARLEFPNTDGKLKPGMYAEATIEADLGEHLVVDSDAVLDSGVRQIVFVDRGEGRFEPREIKAGARAGGQVVVLEGLQEGERIVTSGNFLLDSETRLKSGLEQMGGMKAMEGMEGMEGPSKGEGAAHRH
jgi:Cu(I)/Ag(I) efflux system membrane fusion protein